MSLRDGGAPGKPWGQRFGHDERRKLGARGGGKTKKDGTRWRLDGQGKSEDEMVEWVR